jgi:hypothetical protein
MATRKSRQRSFAAALVGTWAITSPLTNSIFGHKKRGRPRKHKIGKLTFCLKKLAEYDIPCEVCKTPAYKCFWIYDKEHKKKWIFVCSHDCKVMWLFKEGRA